MIAGLHRGLPFALLLLARRANDFGPGAAQARVTLRPFFLESRGRKDSSAFP